MSGIEHLTKCFNCNEPYDVAKFLPCGYSICSKCEKANQVIDCARFKASHSCAQVHKLRSGENQELPTNHSIMQLMKLLSNQANELKEKSDHKMNTILNNDSDLFNQHGLKSILKHNKEANNNNNNNNNNNKYETSENSALLDNLHRLKEKLDTLTANYVNGKRVIDAEYKQIANEIDKAYQLHADHLVERKSQLFESIEERKHEVMRDFERQMENNKNAKEFLEDIGQQYERILVELEGQDKPIHGMRLKELNDQLKVMIAQLNQISHLIPLEPKKSVSFNKWHNQINSLLIGEIDYDSNYKIDIRTKIDEINNEFHVYKLSFARLFHGTARVPNAIHLVSKRKALFIYEQNVSRVKVLTMFITDFDRISARLELPFEFETYKASANYDKHIVIAFKFTQNEYNVRMYDLRLELKKEIFVNYAIESIKMNHERIYLIGERSPIVHEFDYEMNPLRKFGQNKREKKPFYIRDDLVDIVSNHIYLKQNDRIVVLSSSTGLLTKTIEIGDLSKASLFVISNAVDNQANSLENVQFLIYNGSNRILLCDYDGNVVTKKSLVLSSDEKYERLLYSASGHLAFVDTQHLILTTV
jgi:hypothetical protein